MTLPPIDRLCAWWKRLFRKPEPPKSKLQVWIGGVVVSEEEYTPIMTDWSRDKVWVEGKWHKSPSDDPRDNMRAMVHKVPRRNAFGGIPIDGPFYIPTDDERKLGDE